MSNMQGKKDTKGVVKRSRAWSDANKQGTKARIYLDNIPKNLKLRYGAGPQNRVLAVRKCISPFPDVLVTKLRTSWKQTVASGASGAFASVVFYLNSCYDPSAAQGSYQPRFFDQAMALYNNYTVYGAKMRIKILSVTTANPGRVLYIPSANTSVPIADCYADGNELPGTLAFDMMGANAVNGNVSGPQTQSRYSDVGRYFGRDQESIMDEANFSGSSSADPTALLYGYICCQGVSSSTPSYEIEFQLTQYVCLRGIKVPAAST